MAPPYQVDYFELPTSARAASRKFLREAFGFAFKDYGPSYAEITGAGVLGGLTDGDDRSAGPLIGIRADDIAAAQQAVEAAGGVVTKPVYDYPGGRRFYFREPGGNELLVYSPSE
jgi:predicted enzyme related to lactoylglutathione lyase